MSNFSYKLAETLRRIRLAKNLSQEELAEKSTIDRTYISGVERNVRNITISSLEKIVVAGLGISMDVFCKHLLEYDMPTIQNLSYILNKCDFEILKPDNTKHIFSNVLFWDALENYNYKIKLLYNSNINIAQILGLRNLSAVIGEIFASSIAEASNGLFVKNPHQDGYPDLLLMDKKGSKLYEQIEKENLLQEKHRFSPFAAGGIEIKSTCGAIPTQAVCNKRNVLRPNLGDQRINLMTAYDWKAHHRETNNLVGITWDFIAGLPTITSVQYSSKLTPQLWGNIVSPREGGGRTTSVSIMTRDGIREMYKGCSIMIDAEPYRAFFSRYNR